MSEQQSDGPRGGLAFLDNDGEMSARIRSLNWSASLGPIETWPQSLKTTVGLLVHSPIPMVLLWGRDGIMIYNDAYSVFAGGRHPQLLGSKVLEGWPEVADFNAHVMTVGMAGGTLSYKNQELTLHRTGKPEQVWMNLDYSPVMDESGKPGGVIAIVVETTQKIAAERAQASATARQRRQFEQAPGFIIIMNGPEHVVEFVNDAHRRSFGSTGWEGKTIREAFPSIEGQGFFELLDGVYQTGKAYQAESAPVRYRRAPDAPEELRYLTFIYAPITDETGATSGIFCEGFDVTETYKAQAALHALNADLEKKVIERSQARGLTWQVTPDLLGALNSQGYFETSNPAWQTVLGWSEEEVASMSIFELLHPDDVERTRAGFELTQIGQPAIRFPNRYRCKDGGYRWISWVGVPEEGMIYCSGRDISEDMAKVAERDRIFEISRDLFGVAGYDGYLKSINPAWSLALGRTDEYLLSTPFADFIHPDDLARTGEVVATLQKGEPVHQFHVRLLKADGEPVAFAWSATPDASRDSDVFYTVGRDITEETRAAAELQETQDALRQAQKMEAVGHLTGGLAHDFNNLLQGITGAIDRAQNRLQQGRLGDIDRFLTAAAESANRAAALTHRLLAFSRRQTLDPKPADVNRLIGGMEELIRRTMGPEVSVEVVGAVGLWSVQIDASQLESSLLNLCINARDAMPGGGKLTIETANKWMDERVARERELPSGQYVSLCVTDTGTGMEPGVIERAFDPFFTTKPLGQGTGLGLSMIYGFARQSGGQVRIYSEIGKGTTMCLYFPRYHGQTQTEQAAEPLPNARGAGESVLVVDDEVTVRMLIGEVLSERDYHVLEAGDGPSALKILDSDTSIDLLVTDVGLPGGMNGRQVADAARRLRPNLKVLFITGYAENAAVGNGHMDPGMAILTKPFTMDALAAKVGEILES